MQTRVDERQQPGEFVLAGSQQFGLLSGITQSLAGRAALLTLLPKTYDELQRSGKICCRRIIRISTSAWSKRPNSIFWIPVLPTGCSASKTASN
ncbi:MAG: hypothetical protein OQL08_02120 [Gammaproteobacteria bacterium]|nr:hypothetical protein [Gammaproteobacteria bacterium]